MCTPFQIYMYNNHSIILTSDANTHHRLCQFASLEVQFLQPDMLWHRTAVIDTVCVGPHSWRSSRTRSY